MKTAGVVGISLAGIPAVIAVVANAQMRWSVAQRAEDGSSRRRRR